MNFKEALAFEAEHVFCNVAEFGELLLIDGKPVPAVWGEENAPAPDVQESGVDAWGLVTEKAVLNVPGGSMPLPVSGQNVDVSGITWTVKKARPKNGLIRLELERNTA